MEADYILLFPVCLQRAIGENGEQKKLKGSDKIIPSLVIVVSTFLVCQVCNIA